MTAMSYICSSRIGNSGYPHVEILHVETDSLPDGAAAFPTRLEAKQWNRRKIAAPPAWLEPKCPPTP